MKHASFALLATLFLAASSCEKEKAPDATPSTAASVASAASATPAIASAPAAAPSEAENIPVAADFEEEVEKTITKANYKSELDALEAELKK